MLLNLNKLNVSITKHDFLVLLSMASILTYKNLSHGVEAEYEYLISFIFVVIEESDKQY